MRTTRPRTRSTRLLLAALVAATVAVGAASCSGTGSDSSEPASAGDTSGVEHEGSGSVDGGGSADRGGQQQDGAARPAVQTGAVIHTGEVVVVDEDLAAVRAEIDRLLGRYGGQVSEETTDNDEDGVTRHSTLVLRVPGRHFSDVLAAFGDFTTVQSTTRDGEDVGTEIADLGARVRTQEVSLRRLRGFLDRAEDVETMIRLESEIAQREASLESLRAQAAYLADQVAMSTVTVRMSTPDAPAVEPDPLEGAGFLAGLRGGWTALLDLLVVAATVAGALLPFAALVGLLGLPVVLWLRQRRRQTSPAA